MPQVKIKHPRPGDPRGLKREILEILAPGVKVTGFKIIRDGAIVILDNENDIDKLLHDKTEALKKKNYEPLIPPEIRAKRTVVLTRIEDIIYENSEQEIHDEIENKQEWAKVTNVYKFPKSYTVKVTFQSVQMAKKARETGILAFRLSVPPSQIKEEVYVRVSTCRRCYAVEEHDTSACPKPPDYRVCSECSSESHTFRECQTKPKKCPNCNGEHGALAMRCPTQKAAFNKKKKVTSEKAQEVRSFAAAATPSTAPQSIGISPSYTVTREDALCTLMVTQIAMQQEKEYPGTLQQNLDILCTANNLPKVIIPDLVTNPPNPHFSQHLITSEPLLPPPSTRELTPLTTTLTPSPTNITEQEPLPTPSPPTHINPEPISENSNSVPTHTPHINIYKTNQDTWPDNTQEIRSGIAMGRFKYTGITYTAATKYLHTYPHNTVNYHSISATDFTNLTNNDEVPHDMTKRLTRLQTKTNKH